MKRGLVWLRRDLRLHDNPALAAAAAENQVSIPVFIFDPEILEPLAKKTRKDRRIHFICQSLEEISKALSARGEGILIRYGPPSEVIPKLLDEFKISTLYYNLDYEPSALRRDKEIDRLAKKAGVELKKFDDHVLIPPSSLTNKQGHPYKIFTPYYRAWLKALESSPPGSHGPSPRLGNQITERHQLSGLLKMTEFYKAEPMLKGGSKAARLQLDRFAKRLENYQELRDFPESENTSMISVYLRHGCISIREVYHLAIEKKSKGHESWLRQLAWREFFQMICFRFPEVENQAFDKRYRGVVYPGKPEHLEAWKNGLTGFPIVDAGMRCLKKTGWMHNRLRMITASFLSRILLLDWVKGEKHFTDLLLDYDFAANNGGWQWASGSGCDAAPYFRIFNPYLQSRKFDPEGKLIRDFCPELSEFDNKDIHEPMQAARPPKSFAFGRDYPKPIVDYSTQRKKSLAFYSRIAKSRVSP